MAVPLFISTSVQQAPVGMLAGVLGTVGRIQERLVRAPRGHTSPTEIIDAPFKIPHITLMTLEGIARWKRQQSSWMKSVLQWFVFTFTACRGKQLT